MTDSTKPDRGFKAIYGLRGMTACLNGLGLA